jgi:hypothetical protein
MTRRDLRKHYYFPDMCPSMATVSAEALMLWLDCKQRCSPVGWASSALVHQNLAAALSCSAAGFLGPCC